MSSYEELYASLAVLGGLLIVLLIIVIAVAVVLLIGKWKFYTKTGQAGWKVIIPFYADYVLACDIAGLKWWWFLILLCPTLLGFVGLEGGLMTLANLVQLFATANVAYNLSKKLNKSTGWVVATTLFTPLMLAIEGYSKANNFNASAVVTENGFIDANKAKGAAETSAPKDEATKDNKEN